MSKTQNTFFPYGAVYCIDRRAKKADIQKDVRLMAEYGLNTIELWPPVMWWDERGSILHEPSFDLTDLVMDEAYRHGMKVIPLIIGEMAWYEYAPDWFISSLRDPWIVEGGQANRWEHNLNFSHPQVQARVTRFLEQFTARYKDHPALYAWNVWDEPHFTSEDEYTLAEFREWLKTKYGTLDRLNMVWERTFDSWEQVQPQQYCWASMMSEIDWRLFCLDHLVTILRAWTNTVKRIDQKHPVMAHPVGSMINMKSVSDGVDDWKISQSVDILGVSLYPKSGGRLLKEESVSTITETLDGIRSAAGSKPFMICELQSHFYSGLFIHGTVSPQEAKLWSWLSVACGAKGIMFWMWHPFLRGWQLSGRGLCNFDGSPSKRAEAAREVSSLLLRYPALFADLRPLPAQVAILYSVSSEIAFELRGRLIRRLIGDENGVKTAVRGAYQALWHSEIPVDFIHEEDLVKGYAQRYKALIIPFGFVISQETGYAIRNYVENGGVVIADARIGVVDDLDYGYQEIPGAGLSQVFGCKEIAVWPGEKAEIQISALNQSSNESDYGTSALPCGIYRQELEITSPTAQVIARFAEGDPAIVANSFGKGKAVLIGASVFSRYFASKEGILPELLKQILRDLNVSPPIMTISGGISGNTYFRCLDSDGEKVIFGFNFSGEEASIRVKVTDYCKASGYEDLITGRKVHALSDGDGTVVNVIIPAKDVVILRPKLKDK